MPAAGLAAVAALAEELLGEDHEAAFVVEVDPFDQRGHGENDIPISFTRVCADTSAADRRGDEGAADCRLWRHRGRPFHLRDAKAHLPRGAGADPAPVP